MKRILLFFIALININCSSIRVFADHDSAVDFNQYKTYAFFKPGIEEVEISDLDKRRILKAIEVRGSQSSPSSWRKAASDGPPSRRQVWRPRPRPRRQRHVNRLFRALSSIL